MAIYKDSSGKLLSGAGILILEKYNKKNGEIVNSIIVVRNRYSGKYMDFGGTYEKKYKSLQETAHHELREESINLYNISPKYFKTFFDIPSGKDMFYRVYVIKINGTQRKYFHTNRKLIHNNKQVSRCWKETDDIAHIPIKNIDFNKLNDKSRFSVFDVDNRELKLHARLKKALYYGKNIIFKHKNNKPLLDKNNIKIHKSKSFTNNTKSFTKK
jgi:hypothetical protein